MNHRNLQKPLGPSEPAETSWTVRKGDEGAVGVHPNLLTSENERAKPEHPQRLEAGFYTAIGYPTR